MSTQTDLAQKLEISQGFLNKIVSGKARPRWKQAKRLEAVTGIPAPFWMEGNPDELRQKLGLPPRRPYRRKAGTPLQ